METLTADLETGAGESPSLETTETPSMSSMLDKTLDEAASITEQPTDQPGDRGDGRDTRGRFASNKPKDETPAASAASVPKEPTEAPVATDAAASPFRYRALGKTSDVADSSFDKDGNVTFKASAVPLLQQAFNALEMGRGEWVPAIEKRNQVIAQLQSQLKEREGAVSAQDQRAKALVEFFSNAVQAGKQSGNPEEFLKFAWNLYENWDVLNANAERDFLKAELERTRTAGRPAESPAQPAPQAGSSMPSPDAARAHTVETIEQWKVRPEFRDVPADVWKQIEAKATAQPFTFLRTITAQDAQQNPNVHVGEVVFDTDLLFADVDGLRKQRETAAKTAELAAKNATRTQATITAPPSVGGTQAPPKAQGSTKRKTLDEMLDEALEL